MTAYYNEIDPTAAAWLRELIKQGHIAPGDVDERSIEDVTPNDVRSYTQVHCFAGIGVWSYALRRAGWSDDRPVWTGSCPCQPFSAAGKRNGLADKRHLWPAWFHLISQCKPDTLFGEQVASDDGLGWLDIVLSDLDDAGYASACIDLCAAGLGAPTIRQRLFWVADAGRDGYPSPAIGREFSQSEIESWRRQLEGRPTSTKWLQCRDGAIRPCQSGFEPWVDVSPSVLGRLRGYGNAINADAASAFIKAAMP